MEILDVLTILVAAAVVLLITFLWVLRGFWRRISPLLESLTNTKGELQLPKISIKQAIGWGIYKLVEGADFSKWVGRLFGGGGGGK